MTVNNLIILEVEESQMKSVGIVQNLDGKFYVQEVNGNVKILKVGDTLVQGDKVFGDPANLSSNKLNIIGNDGNLLTVSGVDSEIGRAPG